MCKKSLLMMLLLALLVPWAANAQTSLFSEDFEGGTMPAGWTTDGSGSWSVGVGDYSTTTGAGQGSYNALIKHGTTGNVTKLITPEIDLSTVASAELSFMHVQRSWAGDIDELRVYYRTSSSEAWTMLQEYTNAYGSWTTEEGIALPNPSSTYQIAFEYTDNYGYGLGIDAVSILPPATCPKPTNLAVTTDGTNATVTWEGTAASYNIEIDGAVLSGVTSPYTFRVELSTTYTVRVQASCDGETSDWTNPVSFTTPDCLGGHSIDYTLTDSYGDGWNGANIKVVDACGNIVATLTVSSGATNSGTLSLCGEYYEFVWHTGSYDSECSFTFSEGGTVLFTKPSSVSEGLVLYTLGTIAMPKPTALDGTPGAYDVELSWNENGTATAWQICLNNDEANLIEANSNPYTLTGLTEGTNYSVKVRSVNGTNVSCWSDVLNFSTIVLCPAPTDLVISDITAFSANVSWTGDAANYEMEYAVAGTGGSVTYDFEDGTLQGWTNLIVNAEGGQWLHSNDNGGGYDYTGLAHSGTGFAMCYSFIDNDGAYNTDAYLVSPNSYQIGGNASLNFWYDFANDDYPEYTEVCIATVANPTASDFTPIWNSGSAKGSNGLREANANRQRNTRYQNWAEVTLDLSAYVGQSIWIAFHDQNYDAYEIWIDDITVNTGGELTWIPVGTVTSPYTFGNLEAETTYMVRVRANCGDQGYSVWLNDSFTTLPLCMVPTNLLISNIDKRSADLAWTANGEETAWQIEISDSQTPPVVTIYDVTTTSFTLPGLQPETRYTVRVRAVCDEELQSAWSSPVTFTTLIACPAPTALAISNITNVSAVATWTYDGDVELEYAEDVWKYYDNGTFGTSMGAGGTIYWGILLTPDMLPANQPLTHIAMYENFNNANPTTISIYSGGDTAPGTFLYSEEVTPVGNGFHEIALAEPVEFDATQNLWIVCYNDADTYPAAGSANLTNPNGRWVSLDGEEWVDINGYGYNYTWMIRAAFGNNTQTEWVAVNNPASPQTIAGLTPETNYMVRLRAVCGGEDGESVWVTTTFTTDVACPAPTALAATPYANSAVLSWEGISESYTVSYRTAAYTEGSSEEFASTSMPSGWTMYTGLLSNVMEDPTALVSATSGWIFGTGNNVFDSHARCNIYSNYQRWLVTPAIEVPASSEFSFDLALTIWSSSSSASPTAGNQPDDKFVVLISTDNMATWTILRQWDNAGSEYVYDNITNNANGEHVSFDFSAYAGQTVHIAFYGESTVSNGDNNLHIDNVAIGTAMPAGEWMTVDADEATATLTGLTAETKYEWKVQGDCGDFGMSEESAIVSFTTTNDLCPVPTNLTVNNETITARTADLSWDGSPDVESFTVRYRIPEHASGGLYEPFNSNSIPAGWTKYSGLVDDVVAGTATLTTTTSGWYSTDIALGAYNMKVNIYGTSAKYWLVTPEVTLTSGNFSFDLALTDYNNSDPIEDATAQADDRFVVLVYANEAWTILREWNNTGSDYVYNTIATEGEAVSIDLSAYVGQNVKIAFYGESTASGGDNDLHIDNVVFGELVPATDWMTVEGITDMNVTLTGLTPETPYEAQVKADCSDPEAWSNTVTFTTLEQTTVTQTIALAEGFNWVSFNIDITLDDLKAALVEAMPGATSIKIQSKDKSVTYNGSRWRGQLTTLSVEQMYKIETQAECEITLEGMPLNPAEHPITINAGSTWIGFPFAANMSLTDAFAGFAVSGDKVSAKGQSASYNGTRWRGPLDTLVPGQGYVFESATDRTFVYPTGSSK